MKTHILDFDIITSKELSLISKAIKKGSVIICPTDTIHGFSCGAFDKKAIAGICRLKKRKKEKSFIFLASSISQIKKFAYIKSEHEKMLKKIWPAPLTVILKSKIKIEGADTAAFRIPANKKVVSLIKKTGCPIISTSVNISGKKNLNHEEIIKKFTHKVEYILLSKKTRVKPSSIADLSGDKIKMIRQGEISLKN